MKRIILAMLMVLGISLASQAQIYISTTPVIYGVTKVWVEVDNSWFETFLYEDYCRICGHYYHCIHRPGKSNVWYRVPMYATVGTIVYLHQPHFRPVHYHRYYNERPYHYEWYHPEHMHSRPYAKPAPVHKSASTYHKPSPSHTGTNNVVTRPSGRPAYNSPRSTTSTRSSQPYTSRPSSSTSHEKSSTSVSSHSSSSRPASSSTRSSMPTSTQSRGASTRH